MVDVRLNLVLELGEVLAYGKFLHMPCAWQGQNQRRSCAWQANLKDARTKSQEKYKQTARTIQVPATFEGHPVSGKVFRLNVSKCKS
jgi:hypothetical protein